MDYKKMYKEALERARAYFENENYTEMADVFPELAESDDERIRKEIIHYILYKASGISAEQEHAWISYLEKQKEHKPNIELIQKSWYMEGYHDRGFNKEPKWIIKTGEGGPRYEENPKYGQHIEQKSSEWSEKYIAGIFEKVGLAKIVREQGNDALTNAVQSAMIELSKSAEWSEEDEKALERAIDCVRSWEIDYCDGDNRTSERLKSLRPVSKESLQPHWKPSEEQMKALEKAIIKVHSADEIPILTELRQQLKKLM